MKAHPSNLSGGGELRLQMTPMIDIVFQLLVFFLLTFRIVAQEGDFEIMAPLPGRPTGASNVDAMPVKIRLRSGPNGELTSVEMNDSIVIGVNEDGEGNWSNLRNRIMGVMGGEQGPSQHEVEVELDCDYDLRYQHVIAAITAVSGYIQEDEIIHLVEKIKFRPPRRPNS